MLLVAGIGYWVYDTRIRKDSGIAACEAFRDSKRIDGTTANGKTMTEDEYLKLRKVFQNSRYADIRAAGTKLMDVAWQVEQLGPNPGIGALVYVSEITSAATGMQGACADHGIVITMNLHTTPTPASTS